MNLIHDQQEIDINLVKTDESNPNNMTDMQMLGLIESLNRFGFVEPIIVNQDNVIADGEHRYIAWSKIGHNTIKAIKFEMTEAERKLLRQAKNKLKGKHDPQKDADDLQVLISESDDLDLVATLTGQTSESLEDFIKSMTQNDDDVIDVVEHERGLPSKDKLFDITCPSCGATFNIDDSKNNGS